MQQEQEIAEEPQLAKDVRRFFKENDEHGIFSKFEFLRYIGSLTAREHEHLAEMFSLMTDRFPINHLIRLSKPNHAGTDLVKCNFSLPNGKVKLRVKSHEGIFILLTIYQQGLDPMTLSMDELIQEAHSAR